VIYRKKFECDRCHKILDVESTGPLDYAFGCSRVHCDGYMRPYREDDKVEEKIVDSGILNPMKECGNASCTIEDFHSGFCLTRGS
jgi:hypothetical protein